MCKENKIKLDISFGVFLFINLLFSIKYLERTTKYYIVLSLAISGIYILLWSIKNILNSLNTYLKWFNLFGLLSFIIGGIYIFKIIPVESLNVDRWSIITGFWDTVMSGEYAYYGKGHTGNPPGPMPFYFLLAYPFYLIGELGFYSLLGILVFYFLLHYTNFPVYLKTIGIVLIMLSSFYLWEVVSRSNIFTNSVLILLSMLYILKQKSFNSRNILISGIITGLLLSTRNVFIITYLIIFLYLLRTKKITTFQVVAIGGIAVLFFSLTFIPVIIGHYDAFFEINPFVIQSSFLIPFEYTLGFIIMAIVFSFFCKTDNDVLFYSGFTLLLSILIYFLYHIITSGFEIAYFKSKCDISYFILCTPFLIYYLLLQSKKTT